jgi:hypothetical protein
MEASCPSCQEKKTISKKQGITRKSQKATVAFMLRITHEWWCHHSIPGSGSCPCCFTCSRGFNRTTVPQKECRPAAYQTRSPLLRPCRRQCTVAQEMPSAMLPACLTKDERPDAEEGASPIAGLAPPGHFSGPRMLARGWSHTTE